MTDILKLLGLLELAAPHQRPGPAPSPNPTARASALKPEEVEQHRSLSCGEYDECLDAAFRRRWRSWTCERCKLFRLARYLGAMETGHEATLRPFA